MTEAGLRRLEVDALGDETCGVGPAEVVERQAGDAGCLAGRDPGPAAPVGVVQRAAVRGREEQVGAVGAGEPESGEVLSQQA